MVSSLTEYCVPGIARKHWNTVSGFSCSTCKSLLTDTSNNPSFSTVNVVVSPLSWYLQCWYYIHRGNDCIKTINLHINFKSIGCTCWYQFYLLPQESVTLGFGNTPRAEHVRLIWFSSGLLYIRLTSPSRGGAKTKVSIKVTRYSVSCITYFGNCSFDSNQIYIYRFTIMNQSSF